MLQAFIFQMPYPLKGATTCLFGFLHPSGLRHRPQYTAVPERRFFNIYGEGKQEQKSKSEGCTQQETGTQALKIEAKVFHYPRFHLVVVMQGQKSTRKVEKKVNVLKANIPRQMNEVQVRTYTTVQQTIMACFLSCFLLFCF